MLRLHQISLILALVALLASCAGERHDTLREADILFLHSGDTPYSRAIMNATANDSADFDHVGIYAELNGRPMVIEAVPPVVRCTPLDSFLMQGTAVVRRVDVKGFSPKETIWRALDYVGKEYDWEYDPGNGKAYCSELIQWCYLDANGKWLFPSAPMNFLDDEGRMPRFWVEKFDSIGKPIPQGLPGTNPNLLFSQPFLIKVDPKALKRP